MIMIYLKLWSYSSMLILLFFLVFLIKNLTYHVEIIGGSVRSQFLKPSLIICNWKTVLFILRRRLKAIIIGTVHRAEFFTFFMPSKSCCVSFSDIDQCLFCNCLVFLRMTSHHALFNLIIYFDFDLTNRNSRNVLRFQILLFQFSFPFINWLNLILILIIILFISRLFNFLMRLNQLIEIVLIILRSCRFIWAI